MPSVGTIQLLLLGVGLLSTLKLVSSAGNETEANENPKSLLSNATQETVMQSIASVATTSNSEPTTETASSVSTSSVSHITMEPTTSHMTSESTQIAVSEAANKSETLTLVSTTWTALESSLTKTLTTLAAETSSTGATSSIVTTTSGMTSASNTTEKLTESTITPIPKVYSTTIKLPTTTQRSVSTAVTNTNYTGSTKMSLAPRSTISAGTTQELLFGSSTAAKAVGGATADSRGGLIAGVIFAVAVVIMVVVALAFMNARRLGPFQPGHGYTAHYTSTRRRKEDRRALYNDLYEEE